MARHSRTSPFYFRSIRTKIVFLNSFLVGMVALFIYLYMPNYHAARAGESLSAQYRSQAAVTADYLAAALSMRDQQAIQDEMEVVRRDQNLAYAVVLDQDERLIAGFQENVAENLKYREVNPEDKISFTRNLQALRLAEPIRHEGETRGILYLGYSPAQFESDMRRSKKLIGLVSIFIFLMGLMASYWISSAVTEPINQVAEAAQRIASGDFEHRSRVEGCDEIAHMATSFNSVVEKLTQARKELEEANQNLEERVILRTKDLEQEMKERKSALEALRGERDRTRRYLDVAEVFMLAVDVRGYITMINRKGCRMLGYPEREILNQHWFQTFVAPVDRDDAHKCFRKVVTGQAPMKEYTESSIIDASGCEHLIAWHNACLYDKDGGIIGILRSGEDISPMRRLENQLRHAQKMEAVGTLAGGIAHDFNNVLTSIIWCSQLTLNECKGDTTVGEYQQEIVKAAERARSLIQQMLTFSRKQDVKRAAIPLAEVLEEAVQLMRASIPAGISLNLDIADRDGRIFADPTQIHQLVINLCTNAVHAMEPAGGVLSITLSRILTVGNIDIMRLAVEDTGCGMDEKTLERIYDPFFTTKKPGMGTGMGLSVVHGIVHSHDGTIKVESRPNVGTCFTVEFPLHTKVEAATRLGKPGLTQGREHVLLIDDEELIIRVACGALGHFGYRVSRFTSAEEAWACFQRDPMSFDIVVTDQVMPSISGVELVQRIREYRPDIPVVFVTGYIAGEVHQDLHSLPNSTLLLKPYAPKTLAEQMRIMLDAPIEQKLNADTIP
ncbi:MAG: ATP-binding protein [Acidobacteriota bacterium]|nr:ATP-binding protein [Acidobacteriota bacterium]